MMNACRFIWLLLGFTTVELKKNCLKWDLQGRTLIVTCRLIQFSSTVLFKDPTGRKKAECNLDTEEPQCRYDENNVQIDVRANSTTKEIQLVIENTKSNIINGNWTCQQGDNVVVTLVSTEKGIIAATTVEIVAESQIGTNNMTKIKLNCTSCRFPRGHHVEFHINNQTEDSIVYNPVNKTCKRNNVDCTPEICDCSPTGRSFMRIYEVVGDKNIEFACNMNFKDTEKSSRFSLKASVNYNGKDFIARKQELNVGRGPDKGEEKDEKTDDNPSVDVYTPPENVTDTHDPEDACQGNETEKTNTEFTFQVLAIIFGILLVLTVICLIFVVCCKCCKNKEKVEWEKPKTEGGCKNKEKVEWEKPKTEGGPTVKSTREKDQESRTPLLSTINRQKVQESKTLPLRELTGKRKKSDRKRNSLWRIESCNEERKKSDRKRNSLWRIESCNEEMDPCVVLKPMHSLVGKDLLPILEMMSSEESPSGLARLKQEQPLEGYSLDELDEKFNKLSGESAKDILRIARRPFDLQGVRLLVHSAIIHANSVGGPTENILKTAAPDGSLGPSSNSTTPFANATSTHDVPSSVDGDLKDRFQQMEADLKKLKEQLNASKNTDASVVLYSRNSLGGKILPMLLAFKSLEKPPFFAGLKKEQPLDSHSLDELEAEFQKLSGVSAKDVLHLLGRPFDIKEVRLLVHYAIVYADSVEEPGENSLYAAAPDVSPGPSSSSIIPPTSNSTIIPAAFSAVAAAVIPVDEDLANEGQKMDADLNNLREKQNTDKISTSRSTSPSDSKSCIQQDKLIQNRAIATVHDSDGYLCDE